MTRPDTPATANPPAEVPGVERVGTTNQRWVLPLDDFEDGPVLELTGDFLGFGTSQRDTHQGHPDTPHLVKVPGERQSCAACRWFETRLFRVADDARGRYLLFNTGETTVPGEQPLYSTHWARSPYEIIDLLTTIRTTDAGERQTFLRAPARRVLAQAAFYDTAMRDAYEGRLGQL